MLDPFPPPPEWLQDLTEPWALYFNIPGITEHIHEIIGAFAFYTFIHSFLSPWLSPKLFPRHYPNLSKRTRLNWDIHVVSLVQCILINTIALWVMFTDDERKSMNTAERVYGYSGACAMISALAAGYFTYDLYVSSVHISMFGVGMLFHAISALWVFSFGFRPFLNFYSPTFILYELSSPFLNIHWFLDKLDMTGSKLQWYNGLMLLFTFFSCRLIWGTWQSVMVYKDMWFALKQTWSASAAAGLDPVDITADVFQIRDGNLCVNEACARAVAEVSKFAHHTAGGVPTWLVVTYVVSNITLNTLNYYWFSKMIEAIMKRFREPAVSEKKKDEALELKKDLTQDIVIEAASKLEQEEGGVVNDEASNGNEKISSAMDAGVGDELRKRKVDVASTGRS